MISIKIPETYTGMEPAASTSGDLSTHPADNKTALFSFLNYFNAG